MATIFVHCDTCHRNLTLTPADVILVKYGYQFTCTRCGELNRRPDASERVTELLRGAGCDTSIPREEASEFVRALRGPHFDTFVEKLVASRCPICQKQCTSPAGVLVHADLVHRVHLDEARGA